MTNYEERALQFLGYAQNAVKNAANDSDREYCIQVAQVYATLALLEKKK